MSFHDILISSGLSVSELSKLSGVSRRTILALDNGSRLISHIRLDTAVRLSMALGVSITQLAEPIVLTDGSLIYIGDFQWFKPSKNAGN